MGTPDGGVLVDDCQTVCIYICRGAFWGVGLKSIQIGMSTFVKYQQVLILTRKASKGGQMEVWWGSGGKGSKSLLGVFKSILEA